MPIMLGLPSSFLIGADVNAAGCILSWWLVFHSPGDFFYRNIARNLPFQIFYVSGAQLFRSSGVWGFVDKGLGMMKVSGKGFKLSGTGLTTEEEGDEGWQKRGQRRVWQRGTLVVTRTFHIMR